MAALPDYEPLRVYVEAPAADNTFVEECWDRATKMVAKAITDGGKTEEDIDAEIVQGAIVDCGSELYHRRNAPFGVTTFATGDGATSARVSVDPMVRARVMLEPYLEAGFA